MAIRLSEDDFCRIVEEEIATLPEQFLPWLENTTIEVERYPDRRLQRQLKLGPRHIGLMGLFEGAPITIQEYDVRLPNRVFLFQRAIESACRSLEQVRFEIRKTILHELAHHFGYDESDLEEFESRPNQFD